jgi:ribosomal protein L39E
LVRQHRRHKEGIAISLKQNTSVPQFVSGAIIVMTRYSQMLFVNALRRARMLFVAQGRSKTGSDQ